MAEIRRVPGNQLLVLDDPQAIWVVQSGAVALFTLAVNQGLATGTRRYLFSCQVGDAIFTAIDLEDSPLELLAVSLMETVLLKLDRHHVANGLLENDDTTIALVETWCDHLNRLGIPQPRPQPPLTLTDLDQYHTHFLSQLARLLVQEQTDELLRLQARAAYDRQLEKETIAELAGLLTPNTDPSTNYLAGPPDVATAYLPLYQAMQAVGKSLGAPIRLPLNLEDLNRGKLPLEAIARASRLRCRRVLLSDRWWHSDCGPLLGLTRSEQQPVALLPIAAGRYEIFDPVKGTHTPVNAQTDSLLSSVAYTLYRPLPEHMRQLWGLLHFGLQGTRRDWWVIGWAGVAIALLGMFIPQAIAILIDQAVPTANRSLLAQMGLGLVAATLGSVLFQLTQGFALVRLEALVEASIQTALWDRLLTLAVPFFRQFSVGDLRSRVAVINVIRRQVSGMTIRTLFTSVFTLLNLFLLFYYSWQLAVVATVIALVATVIAVIAGYVTLRMTLPLQELEGNLFGLVVQLIHGVAKLRVAGAEERAFAHWGKQYRQQQTLKLNIQHLIDTRTVGTQILPMLSSLVFFATAGSLLQQGPASGLTVGTFLAFNVAFGSFISGVTLFTSTAVDVLSIFALSHRAKPILAAQPEIVTGKSDPGKLAGRVALQHVTFRYRADGTAVLDQVSLRAEPGEFIAIVGPSGSGKSTIFRLLLGFDTPQIGLVAYDGQDLRDLDIHAVRRQLGVLLQTSRTTTASIFENIAGNTPISLDEAWEAVRQAGLEEDIAAMPMGMHTIVSEGGSNLSGGQRQRLLIARALARKPRILLFDEATSFLDNRTQAIVSHSLERLNITRIVIAHRLSTIKNADRIYVLYGGHIVQQGRFAELMQQEGLFRKLMQRQLA